MKLKPKHIITTNFDTLTEDGDMVSADANHLLLKIHGDVQNMDSLVLCKTIIWNVLKLIMKWVVNIS